MKEIIDFTVQLIGVGKKVYAKKWTFFCLFALIFLGSVAVLATFDLLPDTSSFSSTKAVATITLSPESISNTDAPKTIAVIELPTKIKIPAINLSAKIENPITTNIEVLDQTLLFGAVRYPVSAKLGETGNVVLFGHSSYLPIVGNQAYKTFNGIQKLAVGDTITVYSVTTAYTYKVRSVTKESVDDNKPIPLSAIGKELTLVTCNSFATKSDRFVIVADFVESHPAGS